MPIPQVTDRLKEAPAVVLRAVFAGIGQLLMAVDKVRAQLQEEAASAAAGQQGPGSTQSARRTADEGGNVTLLDERPAPAHAAAHPATAHPAAAHTGAAAARPAASATASGATKATASTAATPKPAAPLRPAAPPKPTAAPKPVTDRAAAAPKAAAPKAAAPKAPAPKAATPKAAAAAKPTVAKAAPPRPAASGAVRSAPAPDAAEPPAPAPALNPPIPGYDDLSIASLRARLRGLDAAHVRSLLTYEKANAHRDDVITMFERRISKIENGTS